MDGVILVDAIEGQLKGRNIMMGSRQYIWFVNMLS